MNLHAIAVGPISAINPQRPIVVQVSLGYATADDGSQVPNYGPPQKAVGQIQPLTGGELEHMDALNLQGDFVGIYINGKIDGIVRAENKGGDLITTTDDGKNYLVTQVLESWPDWTKVVATRQSP